MNRPSLVALLLVALTLALLLLELGQLPVAGQASGARVFGVVEGYAPCDGLAPLQNAMVAATAGLNTSFTTTDPSGNYAFYLPAGTYNLTASAAGYVAQSEQITSAGAGSAITLNFYLEQSAAVTCTSQTATEVQITVDSSPEQGTGLVMVDSVIISTPVTYTWVVGSQHTIDTRRLRRGRTPIVRSIIASMFSSRGATAATETAPSPQTSAARNTPRSSPSKTTFSSGGRRDVFGL